MDENIRRDRRLVSARDRIPRRRRHPRSGFETHSRLGAAMTQHPNFKRMFGEAVRDSVRDHADQNPEILKAACGYHLVRLVRGGPLVPAELWESNTEPDCPENVLDRSRPYFVAVS